MFKKITVVALAAMVAGIASADVVFDTILDPGTQSADRINTGNDAGQTFTTATLTDNELSTIKVQAPRDQLNTTAFYIAVFNDVDQDATTWDKGSLVGVSTISQGFSAVNEVLTWTFSNEVLSDNTVYGFQFVGNSDGTLGSLGVLRVGYENSGTGIGATGGAGIHNSSPFLGAGTAWDVAATVTTIPEPATLGMVAMFGGAILFVRRKMMI